MAAAGLLALGATVLVGQEHAAAQRAASLLTLGAALLLLVAAAWWRRLVEPRARASTAASVVPLALLASAVGLALGHADDLGGWVGVLAAAASVGWMAWRERTVSRPVGALSVLGAAGIPLAPVLVGPVWLLLAGLGLALGRSTITR